MFAGAARMRMHSAPAQMLRQGRHGTEGPPVEQRVLGRLGVGALERAHRARDGDDKRAQPWGVGAGRRAAALVNRRMHAVQPGSLPRLGHSTYIACPQPPPPPAPRPTIVVVVLLAQLLLAELHDARHLARQRLGVGVRVCMGRTWVCGWVGGGGGRGARVKCSVAHARAICAVAYTAASPAAARTFAPLKPSAKSMISAMSAKSGTIMDTGRSSAWRMRVGARVSGGVAVRRRRRRRPCALEGAQP